MLSKLLSFQDNRLKTFTLPEGVVVSPIFVQEHISANPMFFEIFQQAFDKRFDRMLQRYTMEWLQNELGALTWGKQAMAFNRVKIIEHPGNVRGPCVLIALIGNETNVMQGDLLYLPEGTEWPATKPFQFLQFQYYVPQPASVLKKRRVQ